MYLDRRDRAEVPKELFEILGIALHHRRPARASSATLDQASPDAKPGRLVQVAGGHRRLLRAGLVDGRSAVPSAQYCARNLRRGRWRDAAQCQRRALAERRRPNRRRRMRSAKARVQHAARLGNSRRADRGAVCRLRRRRACGAEGAGGVTRQAVFRHCERSEAIPAFCASLWIALSPQPVEDGRERPIAPQ